MWQVKDEEVEYEEDVKDDDPSHPQLVPISPDPTDATDQKEGNRSNFDRCSVEVRRYTALVKICCEADNPIKAYLHHLKNYKEWLVEYSWLEVGNEMETHLRGCGPSWLEDGLRSRIVSRVFRARMQHIKQVEEEGGLITTERAFHFL